MKIRKSDIRIPGPEGKTVRRYIVEYYSIFGGWWPLVSRRRGNIYRSRKDRDEWVRLFLAITKGRVKLVK